MDAVLHRIEALPGDGRFALTFRRPDGSEQTAVAHLRDADLDVAPASLPPGWEPRSALLDAATTALRAISEARRLVPARTLRDIDGGWDVSLGNVVVGADGRPACTAHGPMTADEGADEFRCEECGARAALG